MRHVVADLAHQPTGGEADIIGLPNDNHDLMRGWVSPVRPKAAEQLHL